MNIGAHRWVFLFCCTVSIGAGCEDHIPDSTKIIIARITTQLQAIDLNGKAIELGISLDQLVHERITKSNSLMQVDEKQQQSGRNQAAKLGVTARLLPDGFTKRLHTIVSAQVTQTRSIPLTADINAEGITAPEDETRLKSLYIEHLVKTLDEAFLVIDEQVSLLASGPDSLIKALEHEKADVRMAAIRSLGERRSRKAVEPLCKILRQEKAEIGQAAIGALAMIGDQKAVPCIIQWAGSDDRRLLLIIEPLTLVGGEEAEAFIEMIASDHDDEAIRRVAEYGLRRISAQPGSKASSSTTNGRR